MKKFEELFQGSGFPTSEGNDFLQKFEDLLNEYFTNPEVKGMRPSQIRTMGSYMTKMLGDIIFKATISS